MHSKRYLQLVIIIPALALGILACSDDSQITPDSGAVDKGITDGAGGDASFPNKPGGNPLVPEVTAYPFPSDFYLAKDTTTETGWRIDMPQKALPLTIKPSLLSSIDGFSRIPIILTFLPGGVDPKSLPPPADPSITLTDNSPVLLIKHGTWEKVPILVERDLMAPDDKTRALIIRPLKTLDEKSAYVVILRDKLLNTAGKPHQANAAFSALRDGIKTGDPDVEKQRESHKLVAAAMAQLKLKPAEVVQAWAFHTCSEKVVTAKLLALQAAANTDPLPKYSITSDKDETSGTKTNRQIVATMTVNNYVGTDGQIKLDSGGKPVAQGTRAVKFGMTIPSTIDGPRPIILYGHGFFGGWIQGTRGSWNDIATKYKFNTAATNFGFHEDLETTTMSALSVDMKKIETVVSEVQQAFYNTTLMGRLVSETLSKTLTGKDSKGNPITLLDSKKIYYHGISNGGTFGYVMAATCPYLTRASIIVGGGGLTHFLQRAVQWWDYINFLKMLYPNPPEQQLMMSLVQHKLDPVDSMNYVGHLVQNRYAGYPPLKAALHMAINDCQVNNLVTEWVARTAGIPYISPSPKKIFSLKTITAPSPGGAPAGTMGAMFVYDEKVTPTPLTNVPPKTDNDTHGTVRKLSVYQQHVVKFLEEGKFVQVCNGPCDPQ